MLVDIINGQLKLKRKYLQMVDEAEIPDILKAHEVKSLYFRFYVFERKQDKNGLYAVIEFTDKFDFQNLEVDRSQLLHKNDEYILLKMPEQLFWSLDIKKTCKIELKEAENNRFEIRKI